MSPWYAGSSGQSHVGTVAADRGDACVYPYVILQCQIIIAVCCLKTALLSQNTVEESVFQHSVIIVELDQKICRIGTVYPLGTVLYLVFFCFACDSVAENHLSDGLAAKKTDVKLLNRTDPIRNSLVLISKLNWSNM